MYREERQKCITRCQILKLGGEYTDVHCTCPSVLHNFNNNELGECQWVK